MLNNSQSQTYKIGIIGDKDSVIGFRAAGFAVHIAEGSTEAETMLASLVKENYAVLFITEDLAQNMQPVLNKYRVLPTPAIIALPGKSGTNGFGMSQIRKSVERAVGADILFKQ